MTNDIDREMTLMLNQMATTMASTVMKGQSDRLLVHSGEIFLDSDGRLIDADGAYMFTTKTFTDPWSADLWLMTDDDARFCLAFIKVDVRRVLDADA